MDNNDAKASFKIGNASADAGVNKAEVDNTPSPVEEQPKPQAPANDVNYGELEYTDRRSVTIMLIKNYSLYRKANDKVLPKKMDYIGSCVQSSQILAANKQEVEAYFPNIVGRSVNDPDFVMRVKEYLNNIRVSVDELGRTFDTSFLYYHKKDYDRIHAEETKIEEEYQKADRTTTKKLREALKIKINALNALEGTKHKYGYPLNMSDYLLYRHCLLYNDVAKDVALVNADASVRFYFKDDVKEAKKRQDFRQQVNRAKANYVACLSDDKLFDAIYIQYCLANNLPVISSLAEDRLEREIKLDKFSTEHPDKFNRIFNNKDNKLIAQIEMLIARGELTRLQYNQNITTADGDLIGANMKEAVAWFKNPANASVVNSYLNRLNNI